MQRDSATVWEKVSELEGVIIGSCDGIAKKYEMSG